MGSETRNSKMTETVDTPSTHSHLNVGIFGGTFNPVHLGHLRSAEEIRETFALDRIYFVPASQPPHKSAHRLATAVHRLKMVELAVADNQFFSLPQTSSNDQDRRIR